jgi:hypothetical protein
MGNDTHIVLMQLALMEDHAHVLSVHLPNALRRNMRIINYNSLGIVSFVSKTKELGL